MASRIDTEKARSKLAPRREPYWVKVAGKGKHLGYRKTSNGGFWIAKLRMTDGQRSTKSLGDDDLDYAGALALALPWYRMTAEKAAGPEPSNIKIKHVVSAYLDYLHDNKAGSSYACAKSFADTKILPRLGERRVADLTTADYEGWLDRLAKKLINGSDDPEARRRGRYNANTALTFLRAALNRAHRKNRSLDADEWRYVKRLENGKTKSRDVFLTTAEAVRLVNSCEGPFRDLVTFGLLTGARLGEIYQMQVRDYDTTRGQWDVKRSKTGPRTCVLTQDAIELLDQLTAGREKDATVFLNEAGETWHKNNLRSPISAVKERAKLDPAFVFYSLRHTFISHQVAAGMPTLAVAQNVGTSVAMIEKFYGKFLPTDKRDMLERGQIKLEILEAKVVNIR